MLLTNTGLAHNTLDIVQKQDILVLVVVVIAIKHLIAMLEPSAELQFKE
jgi:hypothetical protein